jgi:hypothetical protein
VESMTWSMRGSGKGSFEQCLLRSVQSIHILNLPIFFGIRTGLASQTGCLHSLMNPTAKSLQTSTYMACFLSFANRRSFCLIGHEVLLTSSACSASSLGTPAMSDRLHAKMSALSLKKRVSASSYLGSRLALMMTSLDASGRPRQTFLTAVRW